MWVSVSDIVRMRVRIFMHIQTPVISVKSLSLSLLISLFLFLFLSFSFSLSLSLSEIKNNLSKIVSEYRSRDLDGAYGRHDSRTVCV